MSEFGDFLKQKDAYVAIGEFKPGCFSKAQELYEKAVSSYKKGFRGAFLLQKRDTDEGIAVIIWDTIEDMEANQNNEAHQAILEEMNPLFVKPPTTDFYKVCSQINIPQEAKT